MAEWLRRVTLQSRGEIRRGFDSHSLQRECPSG